MSVLRTIFSLARSRTSGETQRTYLPWNANAVSLLANRLTTILSYLSYTVTPVKLKLPSFSAGTRVAKPTSFSTSLASLPTPSTPFIAST